MTPDPLSRAVVLEILQELIRTASVNPTLAPSEGCSEEEVAKVAQQWLAAKGVNSCVERVAPGRHNAVGEVGIDEPPTLVFCAHLDTVGVAGMTIPPFEPKLEGSRVYGCGSYDMKGSAAAVIVRRLPWHAIASAVESCWLWLPMKSTPALAHRIS